MTVLSHPSYQGIDSVFAYFSELSFIPMTLAIPSIPTLFEIVSTDDVSFISLITLVFILLVLLINSWHHDDLKYGVKHIEVQVPINTERIKNNRDIDIAKIEADRDIKIAEIEAQKEIQIAQYIQNRKIRVAEIEQGNKNSNNPPPDDGLANTNFYTNVISLSRRRDLNHND